MLRHPHDPEAIFVCLIPNKLDVYYKKYIHKQYRQNSKHGNDHISFSRYYNFAFVSLADGVSHDDDNRQNWTGMALLQ